MTVDAAAGVPRFDVVLRGYDRRQVDEHVSRMQRTIVRMRSDLEIIRSQPLPAVAGQGGGSRPTPRPGAGPDQPDMIGNFTDRMQGILQAAEEEAAEIRNRARAAARAEEERAKAEVAELTRQRDALLAEIANLRNQKQAGGMLAAPTSRMQSPPAEAAPAAAGRPRGGQQGGPAGPDAPKPAQPRPRPGPARGGQPGPNQPGPNQPGPGKAPVPGPGGPPGRARSGQPEPARANGAPQPPTTAIPAAAAARPGDQPQPGKSAQHRLPGGPYPTTDGQQSMRPRGESGPEPSELFRPVPGADGQRPNPNAGNPADRTALARSVEPGATRGPTPGRGPAEGAATRKVDAMPPKPSQQPGQPGPGQGKPHGGNGQGPANGPGGPGGRPARPGDATVLAPARSAGPQQGEPNGRRDQGPNSPDRAGRPTSGSRQS
jgi:hypothetical protein